MKIVLALLLSLAAASPALAEENARWQGIHGVITALNVNNPVGDNIDSGTFAWTTQSGQAGVNLTTGAAVFVVQGLVINGSVFSGTPGPITSVRGTLVCNPGDADSEEILDTAAVPLSALGHAQFSGRIGAGGPGPERRIPSPCSNPLFLIRIASPEGAAGLWIATGTERLIVH
jgi:hypothetical protein